MAVGLYAQTLTSPLAGVAQAEVDRLRGLVDAGVAPRAQLVEAERALADAQDDQILRETLYGNVQVQELTREQSERMVESAQRQVDRQMERVERVRTLIDAGGAARTTLTPIIEELDRKRRTLDLATARARLFEELAQMARREEEEMDSGDDVRPLRAGTAIRFDGSGVFRDVDFYALNVAFEKKFGRALPVSAMGMTSTHRLLGFDHRGRVDVAINPDQEEGGWLLGYLENRKIPYFAFRKAVAGKATGAHIHLGPPSLRLRAAD